MSPLVMTVALAASALFPLQAQESPRELLTPADLVERGFEASRVVMMNEAHSGLRRCKRTRLIGRLVLPRAHAAGVRHLAAEALKPEFVAEANRTRQLPEVDRGYLAQADMRELLQAALDLGWTLHAYEADLQRAPEPGQLVNWREAEQARNLVAALESLDDTARMLVWCGNSHLSKVGGPGPDGEPFLPMGQVFWELSGIEPFAIDQITTVNFDGSGRRAAVWLETYGEQLAASPARALGFLEDPADGQDADARLVALDNELE